MTPPSRGLVVTYHAITAGPPPLHVDPELFERHLEALVDAKVTALTVSDLAASLRAGALPDRAVAITSTTARALAARRPGSRTPRDDGDRVRGQRPRRRVE